MTTYSIPLQPPSAFHFDRPSERGNGKGVLSGVQISAVSEERQVSTLLYTLGEDTEDVLSSTNILEDYRKKYTEVMSKLDSQKEFNLQSEPENAVGRRVYRTIYCQLVSTCQTLSVW